MNKKLNWQHIRALHKLFQGNQISKGLASSRNSIANHDYFRFLYRQGIIKDKIGNDKIYIKEIIGNKYDNHYEKEFVDDKGVFIYDIYFKFLGELGINLNTSRIDEVDIVKLIEIKDFWNNTDLDNLRNQIIEAKENDQGVSLMFFKSSKYMSKKVSLINAIEKLIGIDLSHENNQQYLKPFHCEHENPKVTILCENFYFLKFPFYIENYQVELLYVGGYNVDKLKNLIDVKYPIYYMGDWDYDGLIIYEKAKRIIDSLENNSHTLKLITPILKPQFHPAKLSETDEYHKSKWKNKEKFICGLTKEFYDNEQQRLIQNLVKKDEWIEEEGNNLDEIIKTIFIEIYRNDNLK